MAGIEDLAGRAVERIYTMAKILSAIHKVIQDGVKENGEKSVVVVVVMVIVFVFAG